MTKKNLTITIDQDIFQRLLGLVAHYQKTSITSVSKSDVIKHLIKTDYEKNVEGK
jgi:predicted CopG family antitoxin